MTKTLRCVASATGTLSVPLPERKMAPQFLSTSKRLWLRMRLPHTQTKSESDAWTAKSSVLSHPCTRKSMFSSARALQTHAGTECEGSPESTNATLKGLIERAFAIAYLQSVGIHILPLNNAQDQDRRLLPEKRRQILKILIIVNKIGLLVRPSILYSIDLFTK